MASIEEVWGSPFPKRQPLTTRNGLVPEPKRDAQKEGRVYNSPAERTQATVQRHRKTIDDLSSTLPIAASDDDVERNFKPTQSRAREHMTVSAPPEYPYSPPSFQSNGQETKLNRILHMIEQNRTGYETSSTNDMLLYIFTGVFFIYTFDTFVTLGMTMRR
jgi:hypothetical protein